MKKILGIAFILGLLLVGAAVAEESAVAQVPTIDWSDWKVYVGIIILGGAIVVLGVMALIRSGRARVIQKVTDDVSKELDQVYKTASTAVATVAKGGPMGLFKSLGADLVVAAEHGIQLVDSATGKLATFVKKETGEAVQILEKGYTVAREDFEDLVAELVKSGVDTEEAVRANLGQFFVEAKHNWAIVAAPAPATEATQPAPAAEPSAVQTPPPSSPEAPVVPEPEPVPPPAPAQQ